MKFEFVEQKQRYHAKIKVIGVGGAGGNAVNTMIASELRGVDFVAANTDCQDLDRSSCSFRIQLGPSITMGLGAGADPEMGKKSAEESVNDIREAVEGADMVFLTAGMGGGTGTGASPVIAKECRAVGALTIGVVTKPFKFEGERRMRRALEGIDNLKEVVDTLIVIPNERLKSLGSKSTTFKDLIARADEVLLKAVKGISDLIMSSGFINLDFADVRKVMENMGTALMGTGRAGGENRAMEAAQMAINSPLLEDISVDGSQGLLMNITGPSTMTMDEIDEASSYIKGEVHPDAEIFWGVVFDDSLGDQVQVTVIATGIDKKEPRQSKIVKIRDLTPEELQADWTVRVNGTNLDTPTYARQGKKILESSSEPEANQGKKGLLNKWQHLKDGLDYPTFLRAKAD